MAIDAGVLIALAAATGGWEVLEFLENPVVVTATVLKEVRNGPLGSPGRDTPLSRVTSVWRDDIDVPVWLSGIVDKGEASVIALAVNQGWPEVAIDEAAGRATARLCRLRLTGSLGILIRAKKRGYDVSLSEAIARIRSAGIWISADVERAALQTAGELPPE